MTATIGPFVAGLSEANPPSATDPFRPSDNTARDMAVTVEALSLSSGDTVTVRLQTQSSELPGTWPPVLFETVDSATLTAAGQSVTLHADPSTLPPGTLFRVCWTETNRSGCVLLVTID